MANGPKVALAVGAGYLLGRSKKMKLALMLAAAGVTGKFPTGPAELVAHGLKSMGSSAELNRLAEQLRGEVLDAAKAAAIAAAVNRVDAINDRLQGVTSAVGADEVLDDVGGTVGDTVDSLGGTVGSVAGIGRRRPESEDDLNGETDVYDEDEEEPLDAEEDYDDEDDRDDADLETVSPNGRPEPEEEAPPTRRRAQRSSRAVSPDEPPRRAPVRRGR